MRTVLIVVGGESLVLLILWLFVHIYDLKRQLPKRGPSGRFVGRDQ